MELQSLLERAAAGEQLALSKLYDSTSRLIYGLVLRILRNRGAADEVLLDVYTQIWRQSVSYDARRGTPLAWLTTIARSRAIDHLRSETLERERRKPLDAAEHEALSICSPEEATVSYDRQIMVRKALNALDLEQREVIELAYYTGMSHSEIASRLNQPLGTVKTRIRRGMMKLREMLQPASGRSL